MKIKHLLLGMLAMAAAVACKQDEPVEEPALNVDKTSVELAAAAGESSFAVTSNQNWVASADADWVSLDPSSGAASEKSVAVKVTAEDNTTAEARTATVTVKAGALTKTVAVTQAAGAGETPGPGDEPQLPKSEWALVGSFGEWNPASELYLSVLDENYFVYYGMELASDTEFKFLKGGAWPPAGQEIGGNGLVEPNTIQPAGGSNIKVTEAGKYDIYLAADLTKFYIMSEGKLPAEAVEPAPVENSWGMMGCFVDNQWATDVPMTKEGEWIVAKGAQFTELTFKIRANGSWADATNIGRAPGAERAVVNGKIEVVTAEYAKANLGGDAADIKLNGEPGTYDVYFSFENLEVYVMEAGFKPGEKEPQNPDPVEITYTVVGTIADAAWVNNAPAGLMAKEGDLYVAKNVPFVWNSTCYGGDYNRIEFKILETGTWDGFAYPEKNIDQYANAEITVQIGGENIALNAPEGKYDVYFDKANKKVWVMEAGFKPGEKEPLIPQEPEQPEQPDQPELQKSEWALVGSFNNWAPTSDIYLSVLDENYFVYYGFDMPAGGEFKFLKGGAWPPAGQEVGGNGLVQPNTIQAAGGSNIKVNEAGKYDIYLAADLSKFYIMSEGKLPSEATEPAPVEKTWGMMGCFVDNQWAKDVPMTKEGEWIVAKGAQFTELTFKIRANESWADATNIGLAPGSAKGEINTKVAVVTAEYAKANLGGDASDIKLNGEAGTYDVYFSYDNLELYVMTPGYKPGETPKPEPTASTIASVLALGANATIPADTFVEGVVISNMDLNNLTSKKGMYIQDETAGLQFYLAANHTFKFGDKVKVDLSGAKVGAYNGAVQISGLALDKIEVLSSGNTVEPKTVTIADFLANKYEGQYVAIENVQVADADLSKTFVMGGAHTSINMEDANGNKFVVFSSKYATYGTTAVPQGSGTIKGISSINNGNMQIIFAQNSDYAGLTGARFGQGTVEPEPEPEQPETPQTPVATNRADFETFPENFGQYSKEFTSAAGWHTVNCAIQEGYTTDINPQFICIGTVPGTEQWAKAVCINGKVGASGVLTSPEIAGGCGTLSFNYGNMFTDKNGVSFQVEVIQNGEVVKTLTFTKDAASVAQKTKYEGSLEVNVSGSFSLKFTNLSPSNSSTSNKDRVSLWNMTWTSFE